MAELPPDRSDRCCQRDRVPHFQRHSVYGRLQWARGRRNGRRAHRFDSRGDERRGGDRAASRNRRLAHVHRRPSESARPECTRICHSPGSQRSLTLARHRAWLEGPLGRFDSDGRRVAQPHTIAAKNSARGQRTRSVGWVLSGDQRHHPLPAQRSLGWPPKDSIHLRMGDDEPLGSLRGIGRSPRHFVRDDTHRFESQQLDRCSHGRATTDCDRGRRRCRSRDLVRSPTEHRRQAARAVHGRTARAPLCQQGGAADGPGARRHVEGRADLGPRRDDQWSLPATFFILERTLRDGRRSTFALRRSRAIDRRGTGSSPKPSCSDRCRDRP